MSRISVRFAKPFDATRFETGGLVSGPLAAGETWSDRIRKWRLEQDAERRAILVPKDASGLLGMVNIIFTFPPGRTDPEAANGRDIATLESLRVRGRDADRIHAFFRKSLR